MSNDSLMDWYENCDDIQMFLHEHADKEKLLHFSDMRKNILEWFDFGEGKKVLEINAGAGIVTELLISKKLIVDIVEMDGELRKINSKKNTNIANMFSSIRQVERIYDYIIYIDDGRMEYKVEELTRFAEQHLNMDGKLFLAVYNKYSAKNLISGGKDGSLNGYLGKDNWKNHLENIFNSVVFYYPVPDHIFTKELFSDYRLPKKGMFGRDDSSFFENRIISIREYELLNESCADGLFPLFSNSYLIICSKE